MRRFALLFCTILLYVDYSEAFCNKTSTFMCPEGYCISIAKVCNGIRDCQGGEDEIRNCGSWSCPERSKDIAKANGYPCKKPCERNEECGGKLKSCMCDDECGTSCFNADATCHDKPPIVQHSLRTTIYRRRDGMLKKFTGAPIYGCVARYTCPEGWKIEGPMPRCTAKRIWSKLAPKCISISCQGPVPQIPHSTDYAFSRRIGGKERPFSKNRPALVGTTVKYTCEDGLRLFGEPPKCSKNLRWTVPNIKCRVPCHDRANDPDVPCGTECDTSSDCPGEMKCYCDGPCGRTCVNPNVNCGNAPAVDLATLNYNNETGIARVARYTCNPGYYRRSGRSTMSCTGSGQWSGTRPVCEAVQCGNPRQSIEATGGYIDDYTGLSYGSTLTFACNERKYRQYGSISRTCLQSGRWSGLLAICDKIDEIDRCPHPGVPINGELLDYDEGDFVVNKIVRFKCNEGYVMYGPAQRTCLWTKEWTGDRTPTCENPKIRHSGADVVATLTKTLSTLPDQKTSIGRSISANPNKGQEIYFLFDISASVLKKPKDLEYEFEFAKRLVERVGDFEGYINYGIMVFALNNVTALDITDNMRVPPTTERVIGILDEVYQNAIDHQYLTRTQSGTNTHVALEKLKLMIAFATANMENNKRHVFVFTDGKHTDGRDPTEIRTTIQNEFGNSIEFYSITACDECDDSEAQQELIGLASNPENYVYIEDIYQLTTYLDQVSNITQDFSKCGQAGNVKSIKDQATVLSLGRSINAEDANEDGWPWQALITFKGGNKASTLEDSNIKGGGSILNRKWILTAAHVFKEDEKDDEGGWMGVYAISVGVFERPKGGESAISTIQTFSMAKYVQHENFDTENLANDIALIKLGPEYFGDGKDGIKYGYYARPVCLPCKGTCITEELLISEAKINADMSPEQKCLEEEKLLLKKDAKVVSTGFGHQDKVEDGFIRIHFNPPKKLQQALLKIASEEECRRGAEIINDEAKRKDVEIINDVVEYTDKMICCKSGDPHKDIDTCKGDSGGPVVREVKDKRTEKTCWTQIGIVSFGWGCGRKDLPGYYTNVARYVSWIDEKMQQIDAAP